MRARGELKEMLLTVKNKRINNQIKSNPCKRNTILSLAMTVGNCKTQTALD